ncbi:MAG: PilZ domain-containing protein [Bryobacteraceae bacterium]
MHTAVAEQRRETRHIVQGEVRLGIGGTETIGDLIDVSGFGFRARHDSPTLQPGQEVSFQHRFFVGKAEVVWTHPLGAQFDSGFRILR